ncbi:transglutaminase superfamily protein [Ruminococcaceae bacterium R-25]|nr:transglutaminase superfamily protein [Ruminococcaceae bacterium R-25]SUQ11560.1 Transglutaminase-like superfamily protein [Oscillospiraceae bacterium]
MHKRIISSLLITTVLISGCNIKLEELDSNLTAGTSTAITDSTPVATTSETEQQKFEFNPHLYVPSLSSDIPKDYWDSFYNLCDALRAGESTFECSSKEAYKWATCWSTLNDLFPVASLLISGESKDGSVPFENGTGKIYYQIPVEEFVAKQAEFEVIITDMLNSCVEQDDTDFEKCIKLYDYIESNFSYVDYGVDGNDDQTYYAFLNKKGLCAQMASAYAYLLLQSGVEAMSVGCYDPSISHSWTYIIIDGKGYHSDPTWGLKDTHDDDWLYLYYFMMTDERRSEGCPVTDLNAQLLPNYWESKSNIDFSATDESLSFPKQSAFDSLDKENKVVRYHVSEENLELKYK